MERKPRFLHSISKISRHSFILGVLGAFFVLGAPFAYAGNYDILASTTVPHFSTSYKQDVGNSGHWRNDSCQLPVLIHVRCTTEKTITHVEVPLLQLYSGAVGSAKPFLVVDDATTTETIAGMDGSPVSSNRSLNMYRWETNFVCSPTATTTLYIKEDTTGTFHALAIQQTIYLSSAGYLGQCVGGGNATNTRNIAFTLWASTTPCTAGGDTMCDMASTTEAIYTVGYSLQLYMGVLLFLIFLYFGFYFVRKFL